MNRMAKLHLAFCTAALLGLLMAGLARADDAAPIGLWRTFDDETGKPRALVRVTEANGELKGVVEKILPIPGRDDDPVCDKCEGEQKGKKVIGMTIMWGMKKSGEGYEGGQILKADEGKIYKSKLKVIDGGKKLEVRGFIGFSLIGKTRIWEREG